MKRSFNDYSSDSEPGTPEGTKQQCVHGTPTFIKAETLRKLYQAQVHLARGTITIPRSNEAPTCQDCDRQDAHDELGPCADCSRLVCRYCSVDRNIRKCLSCI